MAELDNPKKSKSIVKYLTIEQAISLLSSLDGKFKERDYCILTLFLNCGLRLSELVGINLTNINGNTLRVIGKGNKERTLYLNQACIDALVDYLKVREYPILVIYPSDLITGEDAAKIAIKDNPGKVVINLCTDDLTAEHDRINNLKISNKLTEIRFINAKNPYYYFSLKDPDDNIIEITGPYEEENKPIS